MNGDIDDTCLYSGRETLVNLVKENIKNKIDEFKLTAKKFNNDNQCK